MKTRASKTTENKSQAVISQNTQNQGASTSTFQFADNRPEAMLQRKMQTMADNRLTATIQKQEVEEEELLQGKFQTIQKQELVEEELVQGKFEPVQKQELEEEELLQGKFKTVQRQELEEEELLQGKFDPVQRQEIEEEELLQGKFKPIQKKENNTGLPDNLKSGIENLSGYSMDDVKVHRNSDKPAALQAHAYAQGTDIHLGPGQEKHLPHEAWHVVQQKQGRVKPTMQMKGALQVNDDVGLEKEADVMGAKALSLPAQLQSLEKEDILQGKFENIQNGAIIQRKATWAFNESARRHYKDKYGKAYGILRDEDLKDRIIEEGTWDNGNQRIDLGIHFGWDCYIRYKNSDDSNVDGHTYIWHCGPAT